MFLNGWHYGIQLQQQKRKEEKKSLDTFQCDISTPKRKRRKQCLCCTPKKRTNAPRCRCYRTEHKDNLHIIKEIIKGHEGEERRERGEGSKGKYVELYSSPVAGSEEHRNALIATEEMGKKRRLRTKKRSFRQVMSHSFMKRGTVLRVLMNSWPRAYLCESKNIHSVCITSNFN
jgi:hypothetical protein